MHIHVLLLFQQVSSSLNNPACSGDNLYAYNFPNDMHIDVICISHTSI